MTNLGRSQAICNALINGVATTEQMHRIARAMSGLPQAEYDALTNAQKAAIIPAATRAWAMGKVRAYDMQVAQKAVANPDDEFQETPQ